MKRLFLVIIILVLAATTSYAEGYTFRNGISFGDDVETVKSKETEYTVYNSENKALTMNSFTLGTIKDVTITYRFADDDSLNRIYWTCGAYFQEKDAKNAYQDLYSALTDKYGKPLNLGKGKHHAFAGFAIDYAENIVAAFNTGIRGEYYLVNEYQEWDLVVTEDIHIKIDLVRHSQYQSFKGQFWEVGLSYELYSVSENALIEEKKIMDVKNSV